MLFNPSTNIKEQLTKLLSQEQLLQCDYLNVIDPEESHLINR
jgi:hypothetical protein